MNTKQNLKLWQGIYKAELNDSDSARATAVMKHNSAFGAKSSKEAKERLNRVMEGLSVNREAKIKERLARINYYLGFAA